MRIRRILVGSALAMASIGVAAGAAEAKGANDSGPYDPTCCEDSGNGQGKAPHTAGSKGNADIKNPPGQVKKYSNPDNDADNGYECDGNRGVARGNPAHSGCRVLED